MYILTKTMNKKLSKSLFYLSENSRITTKALAKKIRSSQQSASYMVKRLREKNIIQSYTTIVDPVKLGLTNILVGMNFLVFDAKTKKDILSELKRIPSIVGIQECSQGVDLILEYCVSNLSAFNKLHSEIAYKLHKSLETRFMFPVVVKHKHDKTYLISKNNEKNIILNGDRIIISLNENELMVLKELVKKPNISFCKLAQKIKTSAKTVVNIKKRLEKKSIIKGYSCVLNYQKLDINRQIIFLKLSGFGIGEINKLVNYAIEHKNIVEQVKIIGNYQIFLVVESTDRTNIMDDLRSRFSIKDYLIVNVKRVSKLRYLPEDI